jgi:hypothetical protein
MGAHVGSNLQVVTHKIDLSPTGQDLGHGLCHLRSDSAPPRFLKPGVAELEAHRVQVGELERLEGGDDVGMHIVQIALGVGGLLAA